MKVNKHETTTIITDEQGNILSNRVAVSYMIHPDEGKLLRNKETGYTTDSYIGVSSKADVDKYEEIDAKLDIK